MLVRFVKLGELSSGWVVYWDRKNREYVKVFYGGHAGRRRRRFIRMFYLLCGADIAVFVGVASKIDDFTPPVFVVRVIAVLLGVAIGALMSYLLGAGIPFSSREKASIADVAQCLNNPMVAWFMVIGHPLLCILISYGYLSLFIYMMFNEYIDSCAWVQEDVKDFLVLWGPLYAFSLWTVLIVFIAFFGTPARRFCCWVKSRFRREA